ncbi:MAG: hypothetical protein GEU90_10515 [Gemmatimonas sp.]|nr:hypothetical protein [Gemmatimonas sp.]
MGVAVAIPRLRVSRGCTEPVVIPAQAGIQPLDPRLRDACAGMTTPDSDGARQMRTLMFSAAPLRILASALVVACGCAPASRGVAPTPAPAPTPVGPRLPQPPTVLGDLRIEVVYPPEGSTITPVDSNFIFGNVGRGDASLTINGAPVEVAQNGAWLAFLPLPEDGVYQLGATAQGQTVSATRTIQLSGAARLPPSTGLWIDEESVSAGDVSTAVRGEPIEVSFRGSPAGIARLILPDGTVVPLVEREAVNRSSGFLLDVAETEAGVSEYVGSFPLASHLVAADPQVDGPTLIPAEGLYQQRTQQAQEEPILELTRGVEVVRVPLNTTIGMLDPMHPRVGVVATSRADGMLAGQRAVGPDQAWDFFWPNGTRLTIDGEAAGFYRVRLGPNTTSWVSADGVQLLPVGTPPVRVVVGPAIELVPYAEWVDVRFSMSERVPFRIDPAKDRLSIEFYGATGSPAYVGYGPENDFVDLVDWEQLTDDVFRFNLNLDEPLWGFRYRWEDRYLVLQVRRPPRIDPSSPLSGLRIAVDAGHKGSEDDTGAVGPTWLREVDATLSVVQQLIPMLEAAGAEVVPIRTDETIVPLIERPIRAMESNAHLFVSVHFNAFPNGVNPFENHGTTDFYYWPQSLGFARNMQRELVAEFGLPNRGIRFQNLALPRTPWMPSVLTETMFMMFPQQEASLRDPTVIRRIAAAHLRAMESFVRQQAGGEASLPTP